jgi:hypothetical protein
MQRLAVAVLQEGIRAGLATRVERCVEYRNGLWTRGANLSPMYSTAIGVRQGKVFDLSILSNVSDGFCDFEMDRVEEAEEAVKKEMYDPSYLHRSCRL